MYTRICLLIDGWSDRTENLRGNRSPKKIPMALTVYLIGDYRFFLIIVLRS